MEWNGTGGGSGASDWPVCLSCQSAGRTNKATNLGCRFQSENQITKLVQVTSFYSSFTGHFSNWRPQIIDQRSYAHFLFLFSECKVRYVLVKALLLKLKAEGAKLHLSTRSVSPRKFRVHWEEEESNPQIQFGE